MAIAKSKPDKLELDEDRGEKICKGNPRGKRKHNWARTVTGRRCALCGAYKGRML